MKEFVQIVSFVNTFAMLDFSCLTLYSTKNFSNLWKYIYDNRGKEGTSACVADTGDVGKKIYFRLFYLRLE